MRGILLSLAIIVTLGVMAPQTTAPLGAVAPVVSASASALQDQVPKDLNVDINVNKGGGGNWYKSPVWIAIGAIAAVVVLLLIVMIARGGGGTTIVKD